MVLQISVVATQLRRGKFGRTYGADGVLTAILNAIAYLRTSTRASTEVIPPRITHHTVFRYRTSVIGPRN